MEEGPVPGPSSVDDGAGRPAVDPADGKPGPVGAPGYIRPDGMGPYLTSFSISDLEEFTGVKAHTIRIWEKRYGLLEPERSDTNIRRYGMEELQKLMNVSFLNDRGFKISRLAAMTVEERAAKVRELGTRATDHQAVLNDLKLAMLRFDEPSFVSTVDTFQQRADFPTVAEQLYLPLMEHVGLLWQTSSICPANEHFVSCLVRRHIEAETRALPPPPTDAARFVLFLPENEIHELGLLYVDHLLRRSGRRSLYLGQSVPLEDVGDLLEVIGADVTLLSIITGPPSGGMDAFLARLLEQVRDPATRIWLTGPQVAALQERPVAAGHATLFKHFSELRPLLG